MQCEGKVGTTAGSGLLTRDRLCQGGGTSFEALLAASLEGDCPFDGNEQEDDSGADGGDGVGGGDGDGDIDGVGSAGDGGAVDEEMVVDER